MHHQKSGRQLSRYTPHRIAMFRNMVDSLMDLERFETTLPKAKELRKYADRVITLGKKGTLHARRRAMTLMRRNEIVHKVFDELAKRYSARPGGYTRIYHLGPRRGDTAPMAMIELVDRVKASAKPAAPAPKGKVKKAAAEKAPKAKAPAKKAARRKSEEKEENA